MKKGSELSSIDGVGFTLNEDINFANPNNEVVVAQVNSENGTVTNYAIKSKGQIISGRINRQEIAVGQFQKFLKLKLNDENITDIVTVQDSEGNEYFEVDYLSQDTVYRAAINRGSNDTITQNRS